MERKAFWKLAASSLIVATTMVGCSGAALKTHASATGTAQEKQAVAEAMRAEQAIHARKADDAIRAAEAAVAAGPAHAGYRALLGRAYLMAGRYASAQAAFEDAMTLGNRDPRTIVSLALIKTAQGQASQARDLLFANMDVLPAADYGLAMAMSGDTNEAIRVLGQAIHDPAAGAKERQNLAYSYALAGRWNDAKLMASMDLAPAEAAKRVMSWAAMAQAGAESERVIAMVGVRPLANDAGQPAALALNTAMPLPTADVAALEPQPEAPAAAPVELEMAAAPIEAEAEQVPVLRAPILPVREAVEAPATPSRVKAAKTAKVAARPAVEPVSSWRPVTASQGSAWVVQLGAYDSSAVAMDSWKRMAGRYAALGALPVITSSVTVNGRTFQRLAVAGFGDRAGASAMCRKLQAQGGNCFVRLGGAEAAPAKWAAAVRAPVKLAAR